MQLTIEPGTDRPTIVCLCGSTKFWREFQRAGLRETLAGKIVLSIGAASGTDDEHFGNMRKEEYASVKAMLDELHCRKVEMADEVLILDCLMPHCGHCGRWYFTGDLLIRCACGSYALSMKPYIGESTSRELAHAVAKGKRIRFLSEEAK